MEVEAPADYMGKINLATPTGLEPVPTSVTGKDTTLCYGAIKLVDNNVVLAPFVFIEG